MIAFLPELYSDELVYSWLSRYYVKSGCLSMWWKTCMCINIPDQI